MDGLRSERHGSVLCIALDNAPVNALSFAVFQAIACAGRRGAGDKLCIHSRERAAASLMVIGDIDAGSLAEISESRKIATAPMPTRCTRRPSQNDIASWRRMVTPFPHSIFHSSPARRTALARERFFEEGGRPSGLISEAVVQSWGRCVRRRQDARNRVEFEPVSSSRIHHALQCNQDLVAAWTGELEQLQRALRSTSCSAMLTDASNVVIAAMPSSRAHERLLPVAHRVGVNLSEEAVGTTAPGIVAKTGLASSVIGGEHFFEAVHAMHCAAAPIRDVTGCVAGVLDISSEIEPFRLDVSALVALYAVALENRLRVSQSANFLLLRLHVHPALLDTPAAGLVGIDGDGGVAWLNGTADGLLGPACVDAGGLRKAEDVFGLPLASLEALSSDDARLIVLPNGLAIWIRNEQPAPGGRRNYVAVAAPIGENLPAECEAGFEPSSRGVVPGGAAPSGGHATVAAMAGETHAPNSVGLTLRACDNDLIAHTLREHGGNVSKAARALGVSRGLIYRRLRG